MKKVLLFVVIAIFVAGLVVAKTMYDKMQSKKDIDQLSKFEMPPDFTPLLTPENLKKEKAPIWDFRAKGPDVVPAMLEIIWDASVAEGPMGAALIVVSHLAAKDAIDPVIEALKTPEGRLSECASVFLRLFYQEEVPEKIMKAAKDAKNDSLKINAYNALFGWSTYKLKKESERLKRKKNKHLKAMTFEGLKESNMICRKICVKMIKEVSLDMEAPEGGKSEVQTVTEEILPFVDSDDKELVEISSETLRILVGNMQHPIQILGEVLKYWKSPKKEIRLLVVALVGVIFKNEDSEISKEKERDKMHQLLEDSEKEVVLASVKLLEEVGKTTEDRQALKSLTENADQDIAEAAKKAQNTIMNRKG